MSHAYRPVQWTPSKFVYDAVLIVGVIAYIAVFTTLQPMFEDPARALDKPTVRMKAFGTCAFLMLTMILCIGPLARLDQRFLALLYNRRHFGVIMFSVAAAHGMFVVDWYHVWSNTPKYVSVLASNTNFTSLTGFPFEIFGILALLWLCVMAVTSHDFWLAFLGAPLWKALHMGVYGVYFLVVLHVGLGILQDATGPGYLIMTVASVVLVTGLHLAAGRQEMALDIAAPQTAAWIPVAKARDLVRDRGLVVFLPGGVRAAVFRYGEEGERVSGLSNACQHQNGPLGEGRVLFDCVTCPWHGFQYRPEDGCSPPPFTEKVPTYRLKLEGDELFIDPNANPPGTYQEPVILPKELRS